MAATEQAFSATDPLANALNLRLPPFPFFTTGEDNIRITSYNSLAGVALKVNARSIALDGTVVADSWDHVPNSDRSAKTQDYSLSGTTLLNLTIFCSAGAPLVGQTFVVAQIVRGTGAGAIVLGTILCGPVTANMLLGFPGSPLITPMQLEPPINPVAGGNGVVSTAFTFTVPTGARWEIISVGGVLITPVTTSAIQPFVTLQNSGGTINYAIMPNQVLAAGSYNNPWFFWLAGYTPPQSTLASFVAAGLPVNFKAPAGTKIIMSGVTSETWNNTGMLVREWLDI